MKRATIVATGLSSFLTSFIGSSVNVALPSIGSEFKIDAVTLGWIATAYLLAAGVISLPFGRLADIKGRKKIFLFGLIVFGSASLLCALSNSALELIVYRTLQGIGGAMIFATAVAILTSVFPPAERGKAIGINTGMVYLGLTTGPFFGGILTHYIGWRSLFLVNVPICIISFLIAFKIKSEWAEARDEKYDSIGAFLYGLMLVFIIYGLTELSLVSGVIGLLALVLFVYYENRQKYPVFEIKLITKNQVFGLSSLAALLNYAATFAVGFLMSLYLQIVKGFDAQTAGIILMAQPIVMVIFAPIAGWISDKIEPRIVASIGMLFTAVSLILFATLNSETSLFDLIFYLMLLGLGIGLFSSPNTNAIMSSVEKKFYSIASATVATMRLLGQLLSMAIVMLIFSQMIGRVDITPEIQADLIKSASLTFKLFSILCFLGIFASLGRGRVRR
ncbi:MAG: MFS transporter [Archaeoglobaceae archaeon]